MDHPTRTRTIPALQPGRDSYERAPFGIVGWAHPITAAGVVFPGWGWRGLAGAAICLLLLTTRFWLVMIPILGGFWICSVAAWMPPRSPDGWIGVDTHFGGGRGEFAGYAQHLETIASVTAGARQGNPVVVLPEGAAGMWTPTVESLWRGRLAGLRVQVNTGAIIVDGHGYDNGMLAISSKDANVLYRERMPVPVSMWRPWQVQSGQGGAQAYFFENPVVTFAGRQVAPLICYEQLLVWRCSNRSSMRRT